MGDALKTRRTKAPRLRRDGSQVTLCSLDVRRRWWHGSGLALWKVTGPLWAAVEEGTETRRPEGAPGSLGAGDARPRLSPSAEVPLSGQKSGVCEAGPTGFGDGEGCFRDRFKACDSGGGSR